VPRTGVIGGAKAVVGGAGISGERAGKDSEGDLEAIDWSPERFMASAKHTNATTMHRLIRFKGSRPFRCGLSEFS